MKWIVHSVAAASAMLVCASGAWAQKGETVKIGWIDPLSGLMAAVGTNQLKTFQLMAEDFNRKNASGVRFEIIPLDNKLSPQETTAALRSAMDQGVRYVVQGNGSGPALAIIDALEKHNARNKGKEVVFLNVGGEALELTGSKCHFYHFRFNGNAPIRVKTLVAAMKEAGTLGSKVYSMNQNYSWGLDME
ncbi:MAG: ABC transporter substrate-binding protein, partial [Comamonas sp.]